MTRHIGSRSIAGLALLGAAYVAFTPGVAAQAALALGSTRITINGTSNVHAYTASTTSARVTRVQVAAALAGPNFWQAIVAPGSLEAFEIAVPAATLASDKEGLDKNMHKALKAAEFKEITFRIKSLQTRAGTGALRALGVLTIAGVSKDVTLDLTALRAGSNLSITGELPLLMTDYGITPPKAMLGMMKTDPKIVIRLELVLAPAVS